MTTVQSQKERRTTMIETEDGTQNADLLAFFKA